MNNCSKAPSEKEWITEIMEAIYLEKVFLGWRVMGGIMLKFGLW